MKKYFDELSEKILTAHQYLRLECFDGVLVVVFIIAVITNSKELWMLLSILSVGNG